MGHSETVRRLQEYTDNCEFERLACDVLAGMGYRGIEPQSVGRPDGGKDALHITKDRASIIHISLRKDWKKKISEDLEASARASKTLDFKFDRFVFVSNRNISGLGKDKLKRDIFEGFGYIPEIVDVERLRVELDVNRQDLREKYLGIPRSQKPKIDELVESFLEKHENAFKNYAVKKIYPRILLLSIPSPLIDNRMKMFDEKSKFVGDQDKLIQILKQTLFSTSFSSKVTSNSFSVFNRIANKGFSFDEDDVYEANLYNDGSVEVVIDAEWVKISLELLYGILAGFFVAVEELYAGNVDKMENVSLVVALINAHEIGFKREGQIFSGEDFYLVYRDQTVFGVMKEPSFKERFAETLGNRVQNFFNAPAPKYNDGIGRFVS